MKETVKTENVIGKQIGIYQVMYLCDYRDKYGHRLFHVKCTKCGYEFDRRLIEIQRTKKCNHVDRFGKLLDTNFQWKNKRLRHIFKGMEARCYNKNDKAYRWYGAKGIKIYQEWLNNYISFENWALSNGYQDDLTIDRIDENKDYCPENCRWITGSDNAKYKSTTYILTVDGISHTGKEWPKSLNLGISTINKMLRKYDEELVKEFICRRLANPNLTRKSHQTWMNVYGLE